MIFKLSSLLTPGLALALAFYPLDAVTAVSVPKSVDVGLQNRYVKQLNRRDSDGPVSISYMDLGYSPFQGPCGSMISNAYPFVALDPTEFGDGAVCNMTVQITAYNGQSRRAAVSGMCAYCGPKAISITPNMFDPSVTSGTWSLMRGEE